MEIPIADRVDADSPSRFGGRERLRKPPLFPVDAGIDRLVANLPCGDPDDLNELRSFARLLTRAVSAWTIGKAEKRQLNRLADRGWR